MTFRGNSQAANGLQELKVLQGKSNRYYKGSQTEHEKDLGFRAWGNQMENESRKLGLHAVLRNLCKLL